MGPSPMAAKQTIVPWQSHSCGAPVGDPERSRSPLPPLPHASAIAFIRGIALMLTVFGGLPAWARAEQAPPASVSQQQTELHQFLTYYYHDPQPERAPELLAQLLMGQLPYASRPSDEHHNRGLMIYFFGRIARDHPAVIRRYEALFPTLPAEGQGMLL